MPFSREVGISFSSGQAESLRGACSWCPWEVEGSMWPLALFACSLLQKEQLARAAAGRPTSFSAFCCFSHEGQQLMPPIPGEAQSTREGGRQHFHELPGDNIVTARGGRAENCFRIDLLPLPTLWITQLSHFIQLVRRSPRGFSSQSLLCPPDALGQRTSCCKWGTALSWVS